MSYHNRIFRAVANTDNGEVSSDTLFHYQHTGTLLTGTYAGGRIEAGHLLGTVREDSTLAFHYHHRNTDGQLMAGYCESTPEVLPNGKIRLHERWHWTSGDGSSGTSVIEEV